MKLAAGLDALAMDVKVGSGAFTPVDAPSGGVVRTIDVRAVGLVVVAPGGGRQRADDPIDPAVGLSDLVPLGTMVRTGDPLAIVEALSDEAAARAVAAVRACYTVEATTKTEASRTALDGVLGRIA